VVEFVDGWFGGRLGIGPLVEDDESSRIGSTSFRSTRLPVAAWALLSKMGTMGLWKCRYFETN